MKLPSTFSEVWELILSIAKRRTFEHNGTV